MDYIIFLVSIQLPFLYIVWKFYQKPFSKNQKKIQDLEKQNRNLASFVETLKMSIERISDNLSKGGKVDLKISQTEQELRQLQKNVRQLEIYTGLTAEDKLTDGFPPASSLKGKDFS